MPASPAPRPGWSLRRKAMTAGAIGILAIGFYLGTLLKGPGLGPGSGSAILGEGESATAPTEDVSVTVGNPAVVRHPTHPGDAPEATPATPTPAENQPVEMVAVLIQGDGYGLLLNPPPNVSTLAPPLSQHFRPATLDEIVARAQAASGNAGGVKVQLVRHKSSTTGNASTLRSALRNAGLPDDAIHAYSDFHD